MDLGMTFIPVKVLDIETEIDPLHLYRPINTAQWSTLVTGKVDTLKDNGRSATALNLQQTTDANRYTHGTDGSGNDYMQSTTGAHYMDDSIGAVADWKFINGSLTDATLAFTVAVDDVSSNPNHLFTTNAPTYVNTNHGMYTYVNGSLGSFLIVQYGNISAGSVTLGNGVESNGPVGIYTYILRKRRTITNNAAPADEHVADMLLNGTLLSSDHTNPNALVDANPASVARIGAAANGLIGKLYECVADDRWWSDDLVRRYHERGVSQYGADNMILR